MMFFLALFPATALTVAGYVVLFLSARSEGRLRTFGKYLGFWAFTLAVLVILGAIFTAGHGGHRCPIFGTHGMHERMHGAWCPETSDPSKTPDATPNAAADPTAPPPAPREPN
jgi:hypothetical protein